MLKVYRINIFFPLTLPPPPPPPQKEYVLYTQFNIDNYGQLLRKLSIQKKHSASAFLMITVQEDPRKNIYRVWPNWRFCILCVYIQIYNIYTLHICNCQVLPTHALRLLVYILYSWSIDYQVLSGYCYFQEATSVGW